MDSKIPKEAELAPMSASDFVMLAGGLTVPLSALQALWNLEDRGVTLTLDGRDLLPTMRLLLRVAEFGKRLRLSVNRSHGAT
jgi:hypothetical protein